MIETRYPICPLNQYVEGNKCNQELCDYDIETRSCSTNCQLEIIPVPDTEKERAMEILKLADDSDYQAEVK